MSVSKLFSEAEIQEVACDIPDKVHGSFKNYLGCVVNRLTVRYYLGKFKSNKHSWAAECSCGSGFIILTSTSLCNVMSCGCYTVERTREVNLGNKAGMSNIKTSQTIDKLKEIKPEYEIIDQKDGKVMSKWDFLCQVCGEYFSARPDNILPRNKGGSQTPCNCSVGRWRGYSKNKDGILYVLSSDKHCKFGITNNFDKRYKQLCRSMGKQLEVELILTVPENGNLIYEAERNLKNKFDYHVDVGMIDGRTEYRNLSDKDAIIKEIIDFWIGYEERL